MSYVRVNPENFEPPYPINQNQNIVYTAFDEAGNSAECIVRLRIPGIYKFYILKFIFKIFNRLLLNAPNLIQFGLAKTKQKD